MRVYYYLELSIPFECGEIVESVQTEAAKIY